MATKGGWLGGESWGLAPGAVLPGAALGWPPNGARGEYIGWDGQGGLSVLRWSPTCKRSNAVAGDAPGGWIGVRFDPDMRPGLGGRDLPMAFTRGQETESYVLAHVRADLVRGSGC